MGLSDSLKLMRPPAENVATQTKPIEVCGPHRASLERGEDQRKATGGCTPEGEWGCAPQRCVDAGTLVTLG